LEVFLLICSAGDQTAKTETYQKREAFFISEKHNHILQAFYQLSDYDEYRYLSPNSQTRFSAQRYFVQFIFADIQYVMFQSNRIAHQIASGNPVEHRPQQPASAISPAQNAPSYSEKGNLAPAEGGPRLR